MRKYTFLLFVCLSAAFFSVNAQIVNGLDTLYGYEWIAADQDYARLEVNEDGFYRINYEEIQQLGWPVASINSHDFQLFHDGIGVNYFASNEGQGPLTAGDYLVFYGEKNRGELDKHLFRDETNQQLNPHYSLYTDEAVYFLTWSTDGGMPYTTVANDLSSPPNAEAYLWRQREVVFSDAFAKEYQRLSGATLHYSHFSIGEGYGSRSINQLLADGSTEQEVTLDLPNAYTVGPAAELDTRYTAALFDHIQHLSVNETIIQQDTFNNWRLLNVQHTLANEVLIDGEARVRWEGFGGTKDEVSVGFVRIRYPAQTIAEGEEAFNFELLANDQTQYLEIDNFTAPNASVYDRTNGVRISVENIIDNQLRVLLPATSGLRQIVIIPTETDLPNTTLTVANLQLPNLSSPDYIILTHSQLRASGDPVQAYANYRASAMGGNYTTAVVNVDDLYDQFAYGVQQHPIAIRNFVIWQRKQNPDFKYLFLVGKGREYIELRSPEALEAALGTTLFIPAFGYPASDNLLVSRIETPTPKVSIGRLPAVSSEEVALYLNKIQGLEAEVATAPQTIEGKSWTKNVLHLGGGGNASERQSIKNHLVRMEDGIEDGIFGANVTGFYRGSIDPLETSQSELIFDRINKGLSLITFFGHSSAGSFDFSIDDPDNYLNVNKYPMMMSLGCYSGNMFADFRSIGERFIFLENGGAGVYAASRGVGFIHALGAFGRYFHEQMGSEYYGFSVGDGLRLSIQNFEHLTDLAYGGLNEQFSLQGDPAFRLNPAPGPDFTFEAGSAKITPTIVNAQRDSFSVSVQLYNLGMQVEDSVSIVVLRELPSGEQDPMPLILRIPSPAYADEVSFRLPTRGKQGVGINTLRILVNPTELGSIVLEQPMAASQNNEYLRNSGEIGVQLFIIDNTALPVWPPEYGLVGAEEVVLKASTADGLAPLRKYYLQLDTTPSFAIPLETTEINQVGGVINWKPNTTFVDSTVYYWRISPDSLEVGTSDFIWENSSFRYIAGIENGWEQAHWGQLTENNLNNINIAESDESLIYAVNTLDVAIRNKVYDSEDPPTYFNFDRFINSPWTWSIYEGLNVVVMPYPTLDYWRNPTGGLYGSVNTASGWGSVLPFAYPTEELTDRTNLIEFLTEIIPDSAYVLIYSAQRTLESDYHPELWAADSTAAGQENIFNVLEAEGASRVRELETSGSLPYILFYQKGVGFIGEALAETIEGDAFVEHSFEGLWYEGEMVTTPVSSAAKWNKLEVEFLESSIALTDSIRIVLEGNTGEDNWEPLWEVEGIPITYYETNLEDFAVEDYPQLRVRMFAYDLENRTIPQLEYIHILHEPLAELAINAASTYSFPDSLRQGENVSLRYAIENIGIKDVEGISISYQISNYSGDQPASKEIASFSVGELIIDTLTFSSTLISSDFEVTTTVNPLNDPKEYERFNNTIASQARLLLDEIDPVIHVTFDGRKILNGDIVSPSPAILIAIEDENLNLPINDINLVDVFLKSPEMGTYSLVDPITYEWIPASENTGTENIAKIRFQPEFIQDGIYSLKIMAKDVSSNAAGKIDYIVEFEVINEQTISNVLPYPNPFVDQARFVYTLTGAPPSDFSLQIMTVSGRIVREVSMAEFGDLQIGTHLSSFVWDGTDEFGDRLANGVYLYRVSAIDSAGSPLKLRDNGSGAYFANGIGKIVLFR